MITFYDLPSKLDGNVWSPNTFKTRLSLNYKGLPFKTEFVEYPDIASFLKKIGGEPTEKKHGKDHYTLPAIHDSNTGKVITDSANIASYLDETYPDTPALYPVLDGGKIQTKAAVSAFLGLFLQKWRPIFMVGLSATYKILNPVSAEYFKRTREEWYGKPVEQFAPPGPESEAMWKGLKDGLDGIAELLDKNDKGGDKLYLFGDTITFADIAVASYLLWLKLVVGPEDKDWKALEGWNGGRWAKLLEKTKNLQGGN